MPFNNHLKSYENLITPYEETRAGFISLALEKNRKATPFVNEAKALKIFASRAKKPKELLQINEIQNSLLTAAGVSDKARNHLQENDRKEAIKGLIETFLDPAGKLFVDELVYRFLLTRGDTLGGSMRNLAGALGEWRFTRILISTCSVTGKNFQYLDSKNKNWLHPNSDPEIEKQVKGMYWISNGNKRTLIYNLTVPTVKKNVDLCLFDCAPDEIVFGKNKDSAHFKPEKYLAMGELKGGIDPAGADEHWKTANSAIERIRKAFSNKNCHPKTFFIGAAIENAMAKEIYQQLKNNILSNGANLTNENQVVSLCDWLIKI
jgi:hypothetical protein